MSAKIEQAFRELREPLLRFARRRLRNEEDALDIVQGIFLRLAAQPELPPAGELSAYLYRSVRNALIDHARRRGPQEIPFQEDATPTSENEEHTIHAEIETCLRGFVDALPPEDREWIRAVYLRGRSQRELAEEQQVPYSSAKSRVQRARDRLRAEFLRCCQLQYDAGGAVAGMRANANGCRDCSPG